jgi:hypothetical protein
MNILEHHFKMRKTFPLNVINPVPVIDDSIKMVGHGLFATPDKPGVYYIRDVNIIHRIVVHQSPITIYYEPNNDKIVGYNYNNQFYDSDGNLIEEINPLFFDYVKLPYTGFANYHIILPIDQVIGNIKSNNPGILQVEKVLGNIKMPKSITVNITYHPSRLISYLYDNVNVRLLPDVDGSQIIQAILPKFNIRTNYTFYTYRDTVIFMCDGKYYYLDGYYINDKIDDIKFLFSINI